MSIKRRTQTNKDSIFGYLPKYEYLRTARHTVSGQMQQQLDWYTARDIKTTVPDILAFKVVEDYPNLFSYAPPYGEHFKVYCEHAIGKRSLIPRSPK